MTSNTDVKAPRHPRPGPRGSFAAPLLPDTTSRGLDSAPPDASPPAPGASPPDAPEPAPPVARAASSPHLRLFVALEFPPAARDALVAFRNAAADPDVWRPVAPEAIHLTLAFLGRRPEQDVPTIDAILRAVAGPAPRLALGRALLLPPRRARVLCASLEDLDGTLADLQGRVSDGLASARVYVPEKRPFRAHATVARLRSRARAPRTVDATPEPLEFAGEALTLFVSRLHPHGARYEPLVRLKLH